MKNSLRLIAILACTIPLFQSCGDDEGGASKTKMELLTTGSWKAVSIELDPPFFGVSDLLSTNDECEKDDLLFFNSDLTGSQDEGATKCDENDPQSMPFTWAFSDSETKLIYDGRELTIDKLDENRLEGTTTIDSEDLGGIPGFSFTVKLKFSH